MSESPGERFRRIVKAWQEQEQSRERSAMMYLPDKPNQSAGPAPRPADKPVHTFTQPAPPKPDTVPRIRPSDEALGIPPAPDGVLLSEPAVEPARLDTPADARRSLERLRVNTTQLVQDYSAGLIDVDQFEAVYAQYQRQQITAERALLEISEPGVGPMAFTQDLASTPKRGRAGQVLGYGIFEISNGARVAHMGDSALDNAVMQPILDKVRARPEETSGVSVQQTEIDGEHWLAYVPGRYTTLVVVFAGEPNALQLDIMEDLHRDFEMVNRIALDSGDTDQLVIAPAQFSTLDRVRRL